MQNKINVKTTLIDILFDIIGCTALSISIQCFSAPNNIAPGGISGISIMLNYLFGWRISILSLVLNIPLLIMAWLMLGRSFTVRTVKTVAIMTIILELCSYLPPYSGNIILVVLCGGVLEGAGLALVFMRSSTTGGTDVASRLIQVKFPDLPMGRGMLLVDGMVLTLSVFVYGKIENALLGMVLIYTATHMIDSLLYGRDVGKVIMIISREHEELVRRIDIELERGCTLLSAKGGYTGEQRPVLMCAVRRNQYFALKRLVKQIDNTAFVVTMEAGEVLGEGFKNLHHD